MLRILFYDHNNSDLSSDHGKIHGNMGTFSQKKCRENIFPYFFFNFCVHFYSTIFTLYIYIYNNAI